MDFEVVLELTRGHAAQYSEAPLREETEYLLRSGEGAYSSARFPWNRVPLEDLQAVQGGDASAQALQRVGDALRTFLEPLGWSRLEGEILRALAGRQTGTPGAEVCIAIRCGVGELCRLPLELVTLQPSGEALGQKEGCYIQWEWPDTETAPRTLESPPEGGGLLFAWSAASGALGAARQLLAIQGAAKTHGHPRKVEQIPHASVEALQQALDQVKARGETVAVLHLLCHGGPLLEDEGGYGLWLNGRNGGAELLAPTTLVEALAPYTGLVGCVVLCACHGANLDGRPNVLGSVAQRLHRAGFPAVVASRAPLSFASAEAFTTAFYDALLAGDPLHRAVAKGRRKLGLEWATLQLYARAKDGPQYPVVFRPYRGLQAFEEKDRRFFFGREKLTQELVKRIEDARKGERPRFQLAAGTSGSGKSSLVKAGLIPELRKAGWRVATLRPGGDGVMSEKGLIRLARAFRDMRSASATSGHPTGETEVMAEARRLREEWPASPVLVVVDQLEECFYLEADEPRQFLECLWRLAKDDTLRVVVLGTFRADLLERAEDMVLEAGVTLKTAVYREAHRLYVEDMSSPELLDAIRRPLDTVGLSFEAGVAEQLCDEAGKEPGALPLVEHAMDGLWQARENGVLTRAAYKGSGGLAGALSKQLDVLWDRLPSEQQRQGRRLLVTLVDFAEDVTLSTRRRAWVEKLRPGDMVAAAAFDAVLEWLVARRLLVRGEPEEEAGVSGWVEIAHETLIRRWTRLQGWLREGRDDEVLLRELERATSDWEKQRSDKDKGDSYLPVGRKLEGFEELERRVGLLRPALARCVEAARDRRRRARSRTQALIAGLLGVVVLLSALSIVALTQWRAAEHERRNVAQERDNTKRERDRAERERNNVYIERDNAKREWDRAERERSNAVAQGENAKRQRDGAVSRELTARAAQELTLQEGGDPQLSIVLLKQASKLAESAELFSVLAQWVNAPGRAVLRHTGAVNDAAFSPNGRRVVTASEDNTARVWEVGTWKLLSTLSGHTRWVCSAAFSPDSKRVLTVSKDGTARVWEAETGKLLLAFFSGHPDWECNAAFSPDGKRVLTASEDCTARVWEAETGKLLFTLSGYTSSNRHPPFSSDGRRVVAASEDNTARVWEAETGRLLFTLSGHTRWVRSAAFSPDGQRVLTASEDETARVWEAKTGKSLSTLSGHTRGVSSAVFSPDGKRVVTASEDETARVWDAETGKLLFALSGHTHRINSAAFSPDGQRVVTASVDKTARVWEVKTGKLLSSLPGHTSSINHAAFSPDGQWILTVSEDKTSRVWKAAVSRPSSTLSGHIEKVTSAVFSPDGRWVATASDDKTARVWEAETGKLLSTLSGHSGKVTSAAFSPNGRWVATASEDKTARVWEAETGKPLSTLSGHTQSLECVAFSPDGRWAATASTDETARVWETETGKPLSTLSGHTGWVDSVAFSPDGRWVATASTDETARVWETETGKPLSTLSGHAARVDSVAFSPDGRWVATASEDKTVRVWEAETGKPLSTLSGHTGWVHSAAFSPEGRHVVSASLDATARIWEVTTGKLLFTLSGHMGAVISAEFSPDGKWVVTASEDMMARVWEVATGKLVSTLSGHTGMVVSAAFSRDWQRVVTASWDGTARIWDDLLWAPRARQLEVLNSARDLTPEERRTFLHE